MGTIIPYTYPCVLMGVKSYSYPTRRVHIHAHAHTRRVPIGQVKTKSKDGHVSALVIHCICTGASHREVSTIGELVIYKAWRWGHRAYIQSLGTLGFRAHVTHKYDNWVRPGHCPWSENRTHALPMTSRLGFGHCPWHENVPIPYPCGSGTHGLPPCPWVKLSSLLPIAPQEGRP